MEDKKDEKEIIDYLGLSWVFPTRKFQYFLLLVSHFRKIPIKLKYSKFMISWNIFGGCRYFNEYRFSFFQTESVSKDLERLITSITALSDQRCHFVTEGDSFEYLWKNEAVATFNFLWPPEAAWVWECFLTLLIALPLTPTLKEPCQCRQEKGGREFYVMINGVFKGVFCPSYLSPELNCSLFPALWMLECHHIMGCPL